MNNGYWMRVRDAGMDWQHVCPEPGTGDVDMMQVLIAAPGFLDGLDPGGVVRAVAPAPGSSTGRLLVAVDREGQVELVACPGAADVKDLSALLGDILATGGRLWHQSYDILARPMVGALGKSLTEWMAKRAGDGWSAKSFEDTVARSLNKGRFPLIVVTRDANGTLREMADYLENMTMKVRFLGYDYLVAGGVEIVQPVGQGKETAGPKPEPASRVEQEPPAAEAPPAERPEQEPESRGAFPARGAAPEQQQVLDRLVQLDELGLARRGFEYMIPGTRNGDEAEGAIVVAVDKDRWPFPKSPEVVVVVNTGPDYLAGYLNLSPGDIEEFLSSLPRVKRKEHKGCLLLRASNVHEADQLVNELRALRAVAETGVA